MEHRTKRNLALMNLVFDFEAKIERGNIEYLEEKTFRQLVAYYEEEHQWKKALEVVEIAISQFQFRSDFYLLKARLLLRTGEIEESLNIINQANLISPNENELLLLKARAMSMLDQHTEALSLLEDMKNLQIKSELDEILIYESYIYENMKDYEMMYEVLKESLNINPKNEEALERMMLCTELSRKYEESITFLTELLNIEPYSYLAWYNLGHAYCYLGEYSKAINALEYAFIINPQFEAGYLDCAELCFQEKKYRRAFEIYEECNSIFGPDSELITHMASCTYQMGYISKSVYYLSKAIKNDPYNDEAYYLLGECYRKQNNWYSAINAYHKAIHLDDRCDQYFFGLAKAYVQVQDYTKATFNFNKATKIGPEQSEYWSEYVSFLLKMGLYQEALCILDEAEEFTFGADLLYCRAITLYHTGMKSEALTILEEALMEDFMMHKMLFSISPEMEVDKEISSIIKYFAV